MIFKNKDASNSSIFGDKNKKNSPVPVDPSVLEGFFRKQTSEKPKDVNDSLISKTILRSSSSQDANVPGEVYLGKKSSRSIFNPESVEANSEKTFEKKSNKFMKNIKEEVPSEVAEDLMKFKGNFSEASKSASSKGPIRSDRISIFDSSPFERIQENKIKKDEVKKVEEKKISKSLNSSDILDSLWSKITDENKDKKIIAREKAIDKLFGDNNGKI